MPLLAPLASSIPTTAIGAPIDSRPLDSNPNRPPDYNSTTLGAYTSACEKWRRSFPILGGRIQFVKFETTKINECLDFIKSKKLHCDGINPRRWPSKTEDDVVAKYDILSPPRSLTLQIDEGSLLGVVPHPLAVLFWWTFHKSDSGGSKLLVDEYSKKLKHYCCVQDVQLRSNPKNARDVKIQIQDEDKAVMNLLITG